MWKKKQINYYFQINYKCKFQIHCFYNGLNGLGTLSSDNHAHFFLSKEAILNVALNMFLSSETKAAIGPGQIPWTIPKQVFHGQLNLILYFCYMIFIIYVLRVSIFMTSPLGWLLVCCLYMSVIELFCGVVCVVILPFWHFCWCRGFCHRTKSDLFLFLLRLFMQSFEI